MKACFVRLDKIGDLVCSLPVDEIARDHGWDVRWVIAKGLGFVAQNAVPQRNFLELDRFDSKKSLPALREFFRREKFDLVVSFQAPWWVAFAAFLEGIPLRAGVRSQWHSYLFLNAGLRQRRSQAVQHEADYNRDLVVHALKKARIKFATPPTTPILRMKAPASSALKKLDLSPMGYVVVHPGMAGSALNWPMKNYVSLICQIASEHKVVITGTAADEQWLTEIRRDVPKAPEIQWAVGQLDSAELLSVLSQARVVVAPSTGVAHLAASLGRPVVSFFSPLRVQHPRRWAPRGPDVKTLLPEAADMSLITVGEAMDEIRSRA